jgi:hypothetical protein
MRLIRVWARNHKRNLCSVIGYTILPLGQPKCLTTLREILHLNFKRF